MKTIKIFAILLLATTVVTAQDINPSEVPAAVRDAFSKENTTATDVEWEKEWDNYKVEFEVDRMDHEIWYNASGTILKKEQDILESDLPQAIKSTIKSKYAGYRVDDVEMTWEGNTTRYEVELEKGRDELKVIFKDDGSVLSERKD